MTYIEARRPSEVARDVELAVSHGCSSFLLRRLAHGGMLDLERLGAARYAAGRQAQVELEAEASEVGVGAR